MILFYLICLHFICDYPLQGDTVAREKNRHSPSELQKYVPWYYWLFSHAAMHALAVVFVTNNLILGILELIAHWIIDYGKCEKWYDIHVDQALHIGCKILWWVALLWLN